MACCRSAAACDDLLNAELDYGEPVQTDPQLRTTHYGAALEFEFLAGSRPQLSGYRRVEILSVQGSWAFGS